MQHKAKYRAFQCVALGVSLLISIAYVWNLAAYGVPPLMLLGGGLAVLGLVHQTAAALIASLDRHRLTPGRTPTVADILYTRAEKTRRAKLLLKGAKNAAGDVTSIERQLEHLDAQAADRTRRERGAWERQLDQARDALADAKVAERVASRADKPAAKTARVAAEKRLKAVERARI